MILAGNLMKGSWNDSASNGKCDMPRHVSIDNMMRSALSVYAIMDDYSLEPWSLLNFRGIH